MRWGNFLEKVPCAIRGSIVNDDNLARKLNTFYTLDDRLDCGDFIVDRDNHGEIHSDNSITQIEVGKTYYLLEDYHMDIIKQGNLEFDSVLPKA